MHPPKPSRAPQPSGPSRPILTWPAPAVRAANIAGSLLPVACSWIPIGGARTTNVATDGRAVTGAGEPEAGSVSFWLFLIPGVLIVASAAAMSVSSNRLATIGAEPATAIVRLASAQLMFAAFVLGAIAAFVPSRRMVRRDFLGVIIAGVASTPILMSAATTEMTDAATTASVITGALLLGAATVVGGATTRQVADTYARWRWARLVRMAEDGGHGILYIERAVHARGRSRVLALNYATGGWVEEDLWGRAAPGFWQLVDRDRGVLLTQRVRVGQRDIAR